MRFEYEGKIYAISFQREYKIIRNLHPDPEYVEGEWRYLEFVKSKFPYTTAVIDVCEPDLEQKGRLKVVVPAWRSHTVGCWRREPQFSSEKGRVRALRGITATIPKDMRPLMWAAYTHRSTKLLK